MSKEEAPPVLRMPSDFFSLRCLVALSACFYSVSGFVPFLDKDLCLLNEHLNPFAFLKFALICVCASEP